MEPSKFPWFMLGLLVGILLGFTYSQAFGQSYVPGEGGQWRQPNQYDSGGVTHTPQGPVYDYGLPKYPPAPSPPPILWYGYGQQQRSASIQRRAEWEAFAKHLEQRARETCLEVVRLQQFLKMLGVEPTSAQGGCDDYSKY